MPHTIPYDPSLTLGNIVNPKKIVLLENLDTAMGNISTAKDELNSLILEKRSLEMTLNEVMNMGVSMEAIAGIEAAIKAVDVTMGTTALDLAKEVATETPKIIALKKQIRGVSGSIESPLDWEKVKIKDDWPLSADSIQMDSQYFSFNENIQSSDQVIASIKSYVANQTSTIGLERSTKISESAQSQASEQYQRHSIQGTLVITCHCTHKNATLITPMKLDVDKAIRVWNAAIKNGQLKGNKFDPTNPMSMFSVMSGLDNSDPLYLLQGATYGSSFVAMVHILNTTTTATSQSVESFASTVQSQFKEEMYVQSVSGGFGVSDSFSASMKNLMSTQVVTSHINIICTGLIPTIKSSQVENAVQQFTKFSPDETMGQLASLQNATASDLNTMDSAAQAARTGQQMINLEAAKVKSVLSGTEVIDKNQNQVFDTNSLMIAFDDYVKKAGEGKIGVPINYYLAPITAKEIATQWIRKYYPDNQFLGVNPIHNKKDGENKSEGSGESSTDGGDK